MTDIFPIMQQKLAHLHAREKAAAKLMAGQEKTCTKRFDLIAKLPETEAKLLKVLSKWELLHKQHPTDYNKTKVERARLRLANTRRQMSKVVLNPMVEELIALRAEIAELERTLAAMERYKTESEREQYVSLTELYSIDNITGDITRRSTGALVSLLSITHNGTRYPIDVVKQLLMTGELV